MISRVSEDREVDVTIRVENKSERVFNSARDLEELSVEDVCGNAAVIEDGGKR